MSKSKKLNKMYRKGRATFIHDDNDDDVCVDATCAPCATCVPAPPVADHVQSRPGDAQSSPYQQSLFTVDVNNDWCYATDACARCACACACTYCSERKEMIKMEDKGREDEKGDNNRLEANAAAAAAALYGVAPRVPPPKQLDVSGRVSQPPAASQDGETTGGDGGCTAGVSAAAVTLDTPETNMESAMRMDATEADADAALKLSTNPPRYELMELVGAVTGPNGAFNVAFLLDSGASQDFVSWTVVRRLGLRPSRGTDLHVRLADGRRVDSSFEVELSVTFQGHPLNLVETRKFRVLDLGNLQAILGQPWLVSHSSHVNFVTQTATIEVQGQGKTQLRSIKATRLSEADGPRANVASNDKLAFISHDELAILMEEDDVRAFVVWVGVDKATMQETHGRDSFMCEVNWPRKRQKKSGTRRRRRKVRNSRRHRKGEGIAVANEVADVNAVVHDEELGLPIHNFDPTRNDSRLYVHAAPILEIGTPSSLGDSATEEEINEALSSGSGFGGNEEARAKLAQFFRERPGITSKKGNLTLSRTVNNVEVAHRIVELPNTRPPSRPAFRMSAQEVETLKKQIDVLLENGFIRPSSSPYGAPVMFVPKPDGSLRFVIDYRLLNAQTVKDTYNLPRDQDLFDALELQQARVISSIDLLFGYWQVHMHPEDIRKTAIRTPIGSFEFAVLPMGLCNAPATFQRMMEMVLRPYLTKFAMVYLDDIIIFSRTPDEHLDHLLQVLKALDKHHLRVKLKKCEFFRTEMLFLGHRIKITDHGIELQANPEKVAKLQNWGTPRCSKDVERFLGLANYYARMIKNYAHHAAPLMDLTGKSLTGDDFTERWGEDQQRAFEMLKDSLTSEPVVTLAKPNRPMIIQTDASDVALGGMLMQEDDEGQRRVVCYFSHKFTAAEKNWTVGERELFGLVFALRKFRHYLVGTPIRYENDHKPLQWLKSQATLSRRQMRWLETLESFSWEFNHIPGKDLTADTLSRPPDALPEAGDFLSYLALRQTREDDAVPTPLVVTADDGEDAAGEQTTLVDSSRPSMGGKLFTSDRLTYLLQQAYQAEAKYTSILSGTTTDENLVVRDNVIYKSPTAPDLFHAIVVPPRAKELQELILREYHDVATGAHLGPYKMFHRIRRHFQWPSMETDIKRYVKSCHACRTSKRSTQHPPGRPVGYRVPSAPFEHIAIDFKTGLPTSRKGNDAFIVIIDKLTRYGTIVPYASSRISGDANNVRADARQVVDIIFDQVIRRWGMPRRISSDRGAQFTSQLWTELWRRTGTSTNLTTAYRPQGDGSSERFIQTVSGLLRAHVASMADASEWDSAVGAIEFAYNDSVHSATGFTPFQLAIGRDPLLPVSVLMHSVPPTTSMYDQTAEGRINPKAYLTQYARNLAMAKATLQQVTHAQRETLMHRSSRQVVYRPGDFAYIKTPPPVQQRTLNPKREGPFEVLERIGLSTYRLDLGENSRRHDVFNESEMQPYVDRQTGLLYPTEARSPRFVASEWRKRLANQRGGDANTNIEASAAAPGPVETQMWRDLNWREKHSRALLAELHEPRDDPQEGRRQPRVLELCAGPNKPASRALRRRYPKATVVTVDIDPATRPDIIADLVTWTSTNLPWPPGYFDVIWASPPCTQYSFAKTMGVRYIEEANAIVQAALRIIETLRPQAWFLENPRGYLRNQPFMKSYSKYLRECTYCRYGAPYRKRTDIWSNVTTLQLQHCDVTPCKSKRETGKHESSAQGGPARDGTPGTPRHRAYEPPSPLMDYLIGQALASAGWDQYDRRRLRIEWQLNSSSHRKLLEPFTPRKIKVADGWIELFASDGNNLCTRHLTPQDDAFSYTWNSGRFYGNPVYTDRFISRTLEKALADFGKDPTHTTTVLVVPRWTKAPWFPLTKQFHTLKTWNAGSLLFTCPAWRLHSHAKHLPADTPGRVFIGGTPWPVMAIGLGIGPRPYPGR